MQKTIKAYITTTHLKSNEYIYVIKDKNVHT